MVLDSEVVGRLWDILRDADLETATAASVRRRLEEQLGVSLLDRKAFIRDQIDLFLQTHVVTPQNDKVEPGAEDDDSENVKQEKNENRDSQKVGTDKEEEIGDQDEDEETDEKGTQKAKSNMKDKDDKRKGKGFNKPCALSPQLQVLVREPELARTEVVKRIWAYIRENDLQDPKNKKKIICDETLLGIFCVKTIDMFKMNKALSKHIWPIEDVTLVKSSPKERQRKKGRDEDSDVPKQKEKRQKGGGTGFLAPLQLSDSLVKFFGTGENALSRGDVVKRMWKYIKENELQDPSDKRRIICDDKLRELFEVDSFEGFTMTKLLTAHFMKTEG